MFLHGVYDFLLLGMAELKAHNITKTKSIIGTLVPILFPSQLYERKEEMWVWKKGKTTMGLVLDRGSSALFIRAEEGYNFRI